MTGKPVLGGALKRLSIPRLGAQAAKDAQRPQPEHPDGKKSFKTIMIDKTLYAGII
jgi:hypothetical protein